MDRLKKDVLNYIVEALEDSKDYGLDCYGAELVDELLNTDYFIIGSYRAKQWLGQYAFEVIEKIKEWELFNIGEVTTDFSNEEHVANVCAYLLGGEILNETAALNFRWNDRLNENTIKILIEELKIRNKCFL